MNLESLSSSEVEKTVIGHLLQYGNTPIVLSKIPEIRDDFFFDSQNQKIFQTIREIIEEGGEVSNVSVKEKGKVDSNLLVDCQSKFCTNLDYHIDLLKKYADRRWLVQKMRVANEEVENKDIDSLLASLSTDIVARIRQTEREKTDVKSLIGDFSDTQEENYQSIKKGGLIGIPFGYELLDNVISGIRAPHYIVVKADTNVGKSSFALNVISNVLRNGRRVVLISTEMSKFQNIARILGLRTGIAPLEIESGKFKDQEIELKNKDELYKQDFTVYENKHYINDIITAIHAEHAEKKVDLVVVDYLQNISIEDSRYESYTVNSQKIQSLCKELNIPILVASQINKEGNARGSGDIDNHADFIIRLDETEQVGDVDIKVTKNRHGMRNSGRLRFNDGGGLSEIYY